MVEQINLEDEVNEALLSRSGKLGNLLLLTERLEQADFKSVEKLSKEFSLDVKHIFEAELEGISWTNKLIEAL